MSQADEHVVYVGNNHPEYYVKEMKKGLDNSAKRIILRARGRAISRAVDVSQVSSRILGLRVDSIKIDTERRRLKNGREIGISTIEITMEAATPSL
ncbi:MAG: hypothetical protein QW074_07810 [Candidatus Caldarchaeum sp.]